MKIFLLKHGEEMTIDVKQIKFTELNREKVRKHAKKENNADIVWFEDEEPPQELLDEMQRVHDANEASRN